MMEILAKLVAIGVFTAWVGFSAGLGLLGALKIATQFWGPWKIHVKQTVLILDKASMTTEEPSDG